MSIKGDGISVETGFSFLRLRFLVYPLSHLHASATFKPFTLACATEDETREFHDVWFAVVSNHPFYGEA